MLTWLKAFLWDETAFTGLMRSCCFGLGGAVATGMFDTMLPDLPDWVGIGLLMLGGMIRSSQPVPPVANMVPAVLKPKPKDGE